MGKPKNNNSGSGVNRVRMYQGSPVQTCLYNGTAIGQGKYFAAMVNGTLILGPDGRPLPLRSVGHLE